MNRNEDETNKLFQEIRNEVIDFTTSNFLTQIVEKYQNQENLCFQENKGNSFEFVKCKLLINMQGMMNFQKRQSKEEKKMEFKINYLKNEIAECLNINERSQCQQSAINNILQIQQDFLKTLELTSKNQ
ncbi:unnamed protein product (macronuclear) [Paramecium tetraurelia]|uniref:Uncharacterized protein n=1 Tax=Paramecium tetraurelia TaxID=5888 RepID=A0DC41_PARTE|nr:uncharacterized protein GSPATT00015485001 [Paramecium tetraurelia]CAK80608.1 unnamed protein product [Paramecium tetraurelia]|eukprot:XP_001448005.1 hypothetical protein (macronuclear) [Paramecium tetraurelia strain d4-2]